MPVVIWSLLSSQSSLCAADSPLAAPFFPCWNTPQSFLPQGFCTCPFSGLSEFPPFLPLSPHHSSLSSNVTSPQKTVSFGWRFSSTPVILDPIIPFFSLVTIRNYLLSFPYCLTSFKILCTPWRFTCSPLNPHNLAVPAAEKVAIKHLLNKCTSEMCVK